MGVAKYVDFRLCDEHTEFLAQPLFLVDESAGTIRRQIDAIFFGASVTSIALVNLSTQVAVGYIVICNFRKDDI